MPTKYPDLGKRKKKKRKLWPPQTKRRNDTQPKKRYGGTVHETKRS